MGGPLTWSFSHFGCIWLMVGGHRQSSCLAMTVPSERRLLVSFTTTGKVPRATPASQGALHWVLPRQCVTSCSLQHENWRRTSLDARSASNTPKACQCCVGEETGTPKKQSYPDHPAGSSGSGSPDFRVHNSLFSALAALPSSTSLSYQK